MGWLWGAGSTSRYPQLKVWLIDEPPEMFTQFINTLLRAIPREATQYGVVDITRVPFQICPLPSPPCFLPRRLTWGDSINRAPSSSGFLLSLTNGNPGGRLEKGKAMKSGCAQLAGSLSDAVLSPGLSPSWFRSPHLPHPFRSRRHDNFWLQQLWFPIYSPHLGKQSLQ